MVLPAWVRTAVFPYVSDVPENRAKKVVIYARLSVSREESVSITRQLDAGRRYAEARGWEVVGEYTDDGVSASSVKPENRVGWGQVLGHDGQVDAVIVWKIDRLARRVLDFLTADQALQERGAGIVAVEDPVDMTTPQGRAFATVLSVFAELEAQTISSRIKDARTALLRAGRVVGGSLPYGWRKVENPQGAGYVLAQDPERISYVSQAVAMVLRGTSVYAVKQWLQAEAPAPRGGTWHYSTLERLLRNPILCGQVAFNPGNKTKSRGSEVLRDEHGMPVVMHEIAVISTDERRRLLEVLDGRDTAQARPRSSKGSTSPLLSRLVHCGHCDRLMHRGTTQGRPVLSCPDCHQTVSNLDGQVQRRLLEERGHFRPLTYTVEVSDVSRDLVDIESQLRDVAEAMTHDDADVAALTDRMGALKELRAKARRPEPTSTMRLGSRSVRETWESAQTDLERREVLAGQIERIEVVRGRTGRGFDHNRLRITWAEHSPEERERLALAAWNGLLERPA